MSKVVEQKKRSKFLLLSVVFTIVVKSSALNCNFHFDAVMFKTPNHNFSFKCQQVSNVSILSFNGHCMLGQYNSIKLEQHQSD